MNDRLPPETIIRLDDARSGLRGFIIVHSTALGPAVGGCRLWRYTDEVAASENALRLAGDMTMANALAGLPFGGAKAVLMLPEPPFNRATLFQAFGRAVEGLGGRFVASGGLGVGPADMALVASETAHGPPRSDGLAGGDMAEATAHGVFRAMEVAVSRRLGRTLGEVTVAVQGVGGVGMALCALLHAAGARLVIAEPHAERAARAAVRFGAEVVQTRLIAQAPADVFAPCALGGAINLATLPSLRAKVVCGAARGQLAAPELADMLAERGVLYAPDLLVNAGGTISAAADRLDWPEAERDARIDAIGYRLSEILDEAEALRMPPARVAAITARRAVATARPALAKTMLAA
ncbi:Glu/Leu/Phe/Val dehydrogenase dimerization domain-containing protein [Sphingomonas sp.]|uniref:Glu/Leu/Phe/Val dehydrogenase dimerization domain-containing protein n=1 Tax=Sphingomonas sp. TaxID=28214 RepID=UPI003B3BE7B6